ncbi:MAG: thiamine pyrophosphate-binding protein [Betaproteobacteria bacterium]|nr:thiamine pyrophosphate-binding protein [Betaproteobacteria bacterium]
MDTVFGVPGESFLAALDGFHAHRSRIRFIACRQEGGASFMAEAVGKLTGRPGVCMVTRGPGATNASIGIHTAFQDSTPMVVIIGQVGAEFRDREAFQEVDYRQFFGPGTLGMAKWSAEVSDAARLPEYISRAFHTALQGRPGPVVLAVPEDVMSGLTDAPVLPRVEPARAVPPPQDLMRWRSLLEAAQRPLMIVGGSGWTVSSARALQDYAQAWNLPVVCGLRFQDTFDNRHRLYAGDAGIGINPALADRIQQADLVMALGVRLGEMTTSGYTLLQAPRPAQRLIHLHPGPEELGRVYAADLLLQASPSAMDDVFRALGAPHGSVGWGNWTQAATAEYARNREHVPVEPMDMAVVVKTIERLAPADTVFTNGAGNFSGWLHRYLRYPGVAEGGKTQLAPTSGAMGYGLPAAIAAWLTQPGRAVVNLAGDGDFLMTGQELATATGYGADRRGTPLISIVVDNGTYGTIRMHQEREYPGRVSGSELYNPDFVVLARAYGWAAECVTCTAEFEPAFARALRSDSPTLIHLKLPANISTSRATLEAIRAAALKRSGLT